MAGEGPDNLVAPLDLVFICHAVDNLGVDEIDVFLGINVSERCHLCLIVVRTAEDAFSMKTVLNAEHTWSLPMASEMVWGMLVGVVDGQSPNKLAQIDRKSVV